MQNNYSSSSSSSSSYDTAAAANNLYKEIYIYKLLSVAVVSQPTGILVLLYIYYYYYVKCFSASSWLECVEC